MSTKLSRVIDSIVVQYGDVASCRCLFAFWHSWGSQPPMTRAEAVGAYRSYKKAQRVGMLPAKIEYEFEIIRDIVLVRRGVDLRQYFAREERRKVVSVAYRDGRVIIGDRHNCLGIHRCIRDITGEIVRVALEM